jgi:hypothetical protein
MFRKLREEIRKRTYCCMKSVRRLLAKQREFVEQKVQDQTITTKHTQSFTELETGELHNSSLHSPLLDDPRYPAVRFIEGALGKDVTCWFVPNPQAVMSMLRSCSFKTNQVAYSSTNDILVRCSV